jgi:microcin C transport system substrate-binding protein
MSIADPSYEGFALIYKGSLERLGIEVTVRAVGDVEYVNRLREWDFDIIVAS